MDVIWQRAVSVLALCVFAGLPVSTTVCMALCPPVQHAEAKAAERAGHLDHSAQHGDHRGHVLSSPSRVSVDAPLAISPPPHCDCPDHTRSAGGSAIVNGRAEVRLLPAALRVVPSAPSLLQPALLRVGWRSSSPPDTTPPTGAPLVLRI